MAGCDDNVEIASNIVLQSQSSYTRRRRNIDTRELVVQHNNKVGIQVHTEFLVADCWHHQDVPSYDFEVIKSHTLSHFSRPRVSFLFL